MNKRSLERRFLKRPRLRPLQLTLVILVVGWVPSVLMAFMAYSILRDTLESRILNEEFALTRGVATLIDFDLTRNGEVMEYYQTLPATRDILQNGTAETVENWLAETYYSHPRIDGMFLTDRTGRLLGSIPPAPERLGQDFDSTTWLGPAQLSRGFAVSPVHSRLQDERMASAIVVAIRNPRNPSEIEGFLGAQILTERIGRRLSNMDFGEEARVQILDQNGFPLFGPGFEPNGPEVQPREAAHLEKLRKLSDHYFEEHGVLYIADSLPASGWVAVLERPTAVAYRAVYHLVSWMSLLAGILVIATAVAARYFGRLYTRQMVVSERIEREMVFNEKILANMPIGIALIDASNRRLLTANDRFLDLARQFGSLGPDSGDDREAPAYDDLNLAGAAALDRVLNFGTPFQAVEEKVVSRSGEERYLTINLLRLQDFSQRTQGVLYLVEDNTADRLLREQLIAANTAKDHFLATLSHELRNPLSPVITMSEELEKLAGNSPEIRSAVEIIKRNVELEARLIDDLLDITKITNGKLQLKREWTDAHKVLRAAVEICMPEAAAADLDLQLDLRAGPRFLLADPARLQQVFWNLLKNAIKFTQKGGELTVRTRNEHATFVCEVQDNGIGIEKTQLEQIFHAFEQGGTPMNRRFGGLGLGLAISRAMVEAHGGSLSAESEGAGRGSLFRVVLPEAKESVPVTKTNSDADGEVTGRRDGLRILLVDDHIDTCHGMRLLLERKGCRVREAHSVEEAMRAGKEEFDMLLSDLGLPDGTGFDVVKNFRAQGFKGYAIALSGFGMESDVAASKSAGFDEHLIKPVDINRLYAWILKGDEKLLTPQ